MSAIDEVLDRYSEKYRSDIKCSLKIGFDLIFSIYDNELEFDCLPILDDDEKAYIISKGNPQISRNLMTGVLDIFSFVNCLREMRQDFNMVKRRKILMKNVMSAKALDEKEKQRRM